MKLKKGIRSLLVFSLLVSLLVPSFAFAAEETATAQIPVTVNIAGGTKKGTVFKVTLTANDESNPMPSETAMTATATGSEDDESFDGSFGPITYTERGDYYYTVTQEEGDADGVTYDTTKYTVMVRVENQDDASGNYIGIKAGVSAWEGTEADKPATGEKLSQMAFDNDYTEGTTATTATTEENTSETTTQKKGTSTTKKTKSVKTGDNSNIFFWTALAVIAAAACIMLLFADQRRRKNKK